MPIRRSCVRALSGPLAGSVWPLEERLEIGRASSSDIQLVTVGVSRQHAVVLRNDEGIAIVDMLSTNGTWMGGEKVQRQELQPGDRFTVGQSEFLFEPMADELLEQMAGDASADTPMGRRILVTSAEAGAGRSLCGIHLALSLVVDHGQTVTYVDLDFNGTPVLPALGVKPGPGVADWLDGQSKTVDTLVIPTELNGLKLIAGGTPAAVSRSGLELDRQAINAFLLALGSRFPDDLIVLGAPAIMTSANATILAGLAAQVVVVVAAGQTQRETLAQSLEALQRHSRVSLLLNKMKV